MSMSRHRNWTRTPCSNPEDIGRQSSAASQEFASLRRLGWDIAVTATSGPFHWVRAVVPGSEVNAQGAPEIWSRTRSRRCPPRTSRTVGDARSGRLPARDVVVVHVGGRSVLSHELPGSPRTCGVWSAIRPPASASTSRNPNGRTASDRTGIVRERTRTPAGTSSSDWGRRRMSRTARCHVGQQRGAMRERRPGADELGTARRAAPTVCPPRPAGSHCTRPRTRRPAWSWGGRQTVAKHGG